MLEERIDFIELKKRLDHDEIKRPEKQNERSYVNEYRDMLTMKRLQEPNANFEDLVKEHLQIFKAYFEKLSRVKDAQYYIEKAYDLMTKHLNYSTLTVKGVPVKFLPKNLFVLNIEILDHLAVFYSEKGLIKESEKLHKEVMAKLNAFSKDFSDTFPFLADYSNVLRQNGNFRGAEKADLITHQKIEALFGDENEYMGKHLSNMGVHFYNMGNFKKAKECYIKSLEIKRKIITEADSLEIALAYNNLGTTFEKMSKLDKAERLYKDALKIRRKKCGEIHIDVAFSYQNLGGVNGLKGALEKAEKYSNKALEIRKKLYGENHVDTANSYRCLGVIYLEKGDFDKAEGFFMKSYDCFKKTNDGENNAAFLSLLDNLCSLYSKTKNMKKYEDFAELYIKKASLFYQNGAKYEQTLKIIGAFFLNSGNLPQFFKYFSKWFDLNVASQKIRKEELWAYANISSGLRSFNAVQYREGLVQMGENSGENSALAGECFIYLADQLFLKEDKKNAKKLFIKAFNITKFCSGINDKAVYIASMISCICHEDNKPKKSEKWLSYILDSEFNFNFEPKTRMVLASAMSDLGIKLVEENSLNKAEKYLLKVNNLYQNHPDETNNFHPQALNALGIIYERKQNYRKAKEFMLKAFNMANGSQADPINIATMAGNLARIYGLLDDLSNAAYYYEIYCRHFGFSNIN